VLLTVYLKVNSKGGIGVLIQIIGPGVVGKATGEGFKRYGHIIDYVDKGEEIRYADIHFICTPENEVEDVVARIKSSKWFVGEEIIVVRSSTKPGTINSLMWKYDIHICHNPEFLRESVAEFEFLNMDRVIIGGCCSIHEDILEELYKPFQVPIIRTTPTMSEMIKLTTNAYLSTTISFWNEISQICKKLGLNSHELGSIVSLDPRIPAYGAKMHGKPFGGKCLPKDLDQMLELYDDSILLKAVKEVNRGLMDG